MKKKNVFEREFSEVRERSYFASVLGEILQGKQPVMKEMIDMRFDSGYEFEGMARYSFQSLRLGEAVQFLADEWEYLSPFYE